MSEFTLNGRTYRSHEMNMMQVQLHVLRRIMPMGMQISRLFRGIDAGFQAQVVALGLFDEWSPLLAKMTDADVDFIRIACLETLDINVNGAWVKLKPVGVEKLSDASLDLIDVIALIGHVLRETFVPFYKGLAKLSPDTGPKTGE